MTYEDERSQCLKYHNKTLEEIQRASVCSDNRYISHDQQTKEQNIDEQLKMSKPLVTEIMEFFYNKEKESKYE